MSLPTKSALARTAALLAVGILALGAAACEDDGPSGATDAGTSEAGEAGESGESPGDEGSAAPADNESAGGASEGTDSPTGTDMAADFELFKTWVDDYADEQGLPAPAAWNFLATGETEDTQCVDHDGEPAVADDTAYFYCGPDEAMYLGEETMQLFADEFGPMAPGLGIAHEWGHHVQTEAGIRATSQADYIKFENQADCIAGSWYGDLAKDRGIDLMEAGKLGLLMVAISEQEGPDRTHGTAFERGSSALRGATLGLTDCSSYFPDVPIVD